MKDEKPNRRTNRGVYYLTDADKDWLFQLADSCGMSASSLVTAIVERMRLTGCSPLGMAKIAFQLQSKMRERGTLPEQTGFCFGIAPLPRLEEEAITENEKQILMEEIEHDLAQG